MRQKLSTLQIRFPDAPVVLHTSVFREEILLRVLAASAACLVVAYATLVSMSIVNVIARKEALEKITDTRSTIAQLEHEYFARTEALTLAQAGERGLIEDVGHVAHLPRDTHAHAVGRCDASTFLSSMLQRIESEVGKLGCLGMAVDAEHPAFVVQFVEHGYSVAPVRVGGRRRIRSPMAIAQAASAAATSRCTCG